MTTAIKIGVSSCLLGECVRYDGGHKRDRYIADTLGRDVTFVPVCPEVGCGMPVPREPMRLEGDPAAPRLVTVETRIDLTDRMAVFCAAAARDLEQEELCGFLLKKGSPSCGLFDVGIYRDGARVASGRGLFAAAIARHFPLLPLEEEGRLNDPALRERFIRMVQNRCAERDVAADGAVQGL